MLGVIMASKDRGWLVKLGWMYSPFLMCFVLLSSSFSVTSSGYLCNVMAFGLFEDLSSSFV